MTATINPYKLLPHPFNVKVYGDELLDEDFITSIREKGILEPVVATSTTIGGVTALYVLSGHRRVEAAKIVHIDVPYRIELDQGTLWQESFLLEVNRQRVKTPEQMAREYIELKRIELALAEKQRANGIRVKGTASERAATKVGVQDAWARKAEVVVAAADAGDLTAIEGLSEINSGKETVEAVYRRVQPVEKDSTNAHYEAVARRLAAAIGFFQVVYFPRYAAPKHGFLFKVNFVCEEEAEAFVRLLAALPKSAVEEFERVQKSWRKV